ncbi:M23 family metallopeptidase [Polyangium sorediatum]|uniref:M23 family metallopeptidase n=3 Tax=Polyangium TaxID=55 RepID=A0A4U1JBF2_9BACT|nr:M23 family metallopeptidase [Polyangium fumosum]MDI1430932.1 M23 family metallopeptidase [Polyangium sorediatum]TKD07355.1 M23 family metallopeptidase [Polyangium fumosum]
MLPRSSFFAPLLVAGSLLLSACGGSAPPPNMPRYAPGTVLYRLPVVGQWRVYRTHYGANNDQAYALDLVIDDNMPKSQRNEDHPSYNQPIVADAPGVVVVAVDGVPDNVPGRANKYDMHGNFVVLDHQNGEYSLFAHFIPGSVRVRKGMFVPAGTELGRCGNSGHSFAPHLHWQIMTDADASSARGVPPRYTPYERNGAMSVELPQKGDRLLAK